MSKQNLTVDSSVSVIDERWGGLSMADLLHFLRGDILLSWSKETK